MIGWLRRLYAPMTPAGEPAFPRRLTWRGAALLVLALTGVARGLSYLADSPPADALVIIWEVIPPVLSAASWALAGLACLVLGPTRWWRHGLAALIVLHGAWAAAFLLAWALSDGFQGQDYVLAYNHVVIVTGAIALSRADSGAVRPDHEATS